MNDGAARQRQALAAGLVLVLVWGASFTIQKAAYAAMGPGVFLFCRSLVMSLCALGLLRWRGSPLWPPLPRAEWRLLCGITLAGPVLHIVLVTYAIHWSTPFSSALIMACGPVCTLVLLRCLRGTRLRLRQAAGVGVALAGVLLFMADKLAQANLKASGGDLMMLLATIVFSLYTIWVTPLVSRHGGIEVMCWTTLLASPLLLLATAATVPQAPFTQLGASIWGAFFWTVLVSAFSGWIAWSWINAVRGVARTAPLLYLVPPVAGVVAWLTIGEPWGMRKLAGAVLALGGVALAQWSRGREVAAAAAR